MVLTPNEEDDAAAAPLFQTYVLQGHLKFTRQLKRKAYVLKLNMSLLFFNMRLYDAIKSNKK